MDGGSLVVTGSVTAAAGALYAQGTTTVPSTISWSTSSPPDDNNISTSRLQSIIQATLPPLLLQYAAAQAQKQYSTYFQGNLSNTEQEIVGILVAHPNPLTTLNAMNSQPCFSGCTSQCHVQCSQSLSSLLLTAGLSFNQTEANTVANDMTDLKSLNAPQWPNRMTEMTDAITNSWL